MSNASKYSADEIERKRQLALSRKKLAQQSQAYVEKPIGGGSGSLGLQQNTHEANNGGRNPLVMQSPSRSNRYDPINRSKEQPRNLNNEVPITATCSMVAENRFGIETSSYRQSVIDIFKTISSRSYNMKTRVWDFHINDYDDVMRKLSALKPRVTVEKLPNSLLQIFKKPSNTDYNSIDLSPIDPKLVKTLMPFQKEGVCHGISKNGRCLIADDMGLGKTLQALGIAHYYQTDWPLLIVSPSSVRYQWASAIYQFLPSVPTQYVHHFANTRDSVGDARVVIMSYDILKRAVDTVIKNVFGVVIFDESHFLKNPKSARTEAATRMASQARRVILLSGTPALSRPMELHSQMCLVVPKFCGLHDFGVRYCAGALGNFGWEYGGSSNMQELQFLLKRCGMIRRTKSEVLTQLPSKMREVVILDPKLIKSGTKQMQKIENSLDQGKLSGADMQSALLQYYRETAIAKLKAINDYVVDLLESKTKFLIFAHHKAVLDSISELVISKNVNFIRIDGSTKSEDRKSQCDLFQEREDYLVAILSVTAANTGITLTAAQRVIFAELYWNPGTMCQAEDRVHRIGQQGSVLIQFLIAKDTSDDRLWPLIQSKLEVLSRAGLGSESLQQKTMGVKNQTDKGQKSIYSYMLQSSSQSNSAKDDTSSCTAEENKMELSHLLEMDDDDLSTLDLDNVV